MVSHYHAPFTKDVSVLRKARKPSALNVRVAVLRRWTRSLVKALRRESIQRENAKAVAVPPQRRPSLSNCCVSA